MKYLFYNPYQVVFDDVLDTSGGPIRGIAQDHSTGLVTFMSFFSQVVYNEKKKR